MNSGKSDNSIVLSGGNGGCKDGGGALVMQNGKGKKNERLIIKDDALIMQDSRADGNLIMDGNNLIFNEGKGKKKENIIIKGSGSGHCCQSSYNEEHVQPFPIAIPLRAEHTKEHRTYVPVPVHYKKKVEHHHHTKEVHHHDDTLGLGSRRTDVSGSIYDDTENEHAEQSGKEKRHATKRKEKKKNRIKIRKLKLGDKLSSKEKESLKLRRVDRRLGLARFRLTGKVMDKIRLRRKKAHKLTNSKDKLKDSKESKDSKERQEQQEQTKEDNAQAGEQQYEDDESEDNGRDQEEDEGSSSNLYEGIASALMYPAINPMPTGYMTAGFNNLMDLYPPTHHQVILPASTVTSAEAAASDRRDLKKKHHERNENEEIANSDAAKKLEDLENVKQFIEENGEKSKMEQADENSKLNKSINQFEPSTSASGNLILKSTNIMQPIFTPDERQLKPSFYSLLALTTNAQQQLAMPTHHHQLNNNNPHSTATLPLFTPTKPNIDEPAALLLHLIGHQSKQQQQLILAQQQKLREQEAEQKELKRRLQQAAANGHLNEERDRLSSSDFFKDDMKGKDYFRSEDSEPVYRDRSADKQNDSPKLGYSSDFDYWEHDKYDKSDGKYDRLSEFDKASINRLRRRKSDENTSRLDHRANESKHSRSLVRQSRVEEDALAERRRAKSRESDFDFADDFDGDDPRSLSSNRRVKKRQQRHRQFEKRMMYMEPEFEETSLVSNVKNETSSTRFTAMPFSSMNDYQVSTPISEMKLASNASLIVYGY